VNVLSLTPVDLVLRVAAATVGASEVPPNTNAGPYVKRVLGRTGLPEGHPWCAAWVTDIGLCALGDAWPVKRTASVQQMAEWAAGANCRLMATKTPAKPGDLFCLWYPKLGRWAHVGIVRSVAKDGKTITTVEANTSGNGSREGWLVAEKTRVLGPRDRLIRWVEALPKPGA
jgi:hypothetical protein